MVLHILWIKFNSETNLEDLSVGICTKEKSLYDIYDLYTDLPNLI